MAYIPKSQIKLVNLEAGKYVFKSTKQPFTGDAMLVSNGKIYAGKNNTNPGPEIIFKPSEISTSPLTSPLGDNEKYFSFKYSSRKYNRIKSEVKKYLEFKLTVPYSKPKPTTRDYTKGYFIRYFLKRINGVNYIEINKTTYDSIKEKKGIYDHHLYNIGSIPWFITGDVHKRNSTILKKAQRQFKNIIYLFPVLNEYQQPTTEVQENLYTSGGELYYSDGTEYIGDYHIHPTKGPMVGATHSSIPHATLYYFSQLPQVPNQSYEEFLHNYNKIDCYRCILTNNNQDTQIISSKRSRILGCLPNTYTTYEKASDHCPITELPTIDLINRPPMIENAEDSDTSFFDTTRPNQPLEGGTNETIYVDDVIDNSGYGGTRPDGGMSLQSYSCFVPNTLVTMADGSEKTISSIKIGEKVKSEKEESTVIDIQIHEGKFDVYSINGGKPFVTPEHPFKTIDGWKAIDPITTLEKHQVFSTTLNLNDVIIKLDEKELVKSIEKGKIQYQKVYNLMLDNEHVYYANGYLVHNEKINT